MKTFLVSYGYKGNQYSLDIKADSWEEAEERVKVLTWARVDGEVCCRIPCAPFGWLNRLFERFILGARPT